MSPKSTVTEIKTSLSKLLPAESLSPEDVERARDMLDQLDKCEINLDLLTSTLIGAVVSKFKAHEEIGSMAKHLVKKWKKIAKESTPPSTGAAAATTTTKNGTEPSSSSAKTSNGSSTSKPSSSSSAKAERRDSVSSAMAEAEIEWAGLQPHRNTTVKKLHTFLLGAKKSLVKDGINANAVEHLAVERATEIEVAIHAKYTHNKQDYLGKARSLCFNIKKNLSLTTQLLLGQITGEELVTFTTEQLASEEAKKEREEKARKILDTTRLDWNEANEDKINEMCGIKGDLLKASLFTCGRCKSPKTTSTQKQTRSADEPMTVFVLCLNCGKRWKC